MHSERNSSSCVTTKALTTAYSERIRANSFCAMAQWRSSSAKAVMRMPASSANSENRPTGAPSAQMAYAVAFSTCRSKKSSVTPDRLAAHRRSAGSARCGDMASNV